MMEKIDIAKNPKSSEKELLKLCEDTDSVVRLAVAKNSNASSLVLERLYDIEKRFGNNRYTLYEIIMNPQCPKDNIIDYYNEYISWFWHFYIYDNDYVAKPLNKILNIVLSDDCPLTTLQKASTLDPGYAYHRADDGFDGGKFTKLEKKIAKIAKKKLKLVNKQHSIAVNGVKKMSEDEQITQKRNELEARRKERLAREKKMKELQSALIDILKKSKEISDQLYEQDIDDRYQVKTVPRVRIPEERLLVRVNDHMEINPIYLEFIDVIDFSLISTVNLKVSGGLDFSRSNISIDPQTVYNKDLSYSIFNDDNIRFKNLSGCNLSGTDISHERDSIGIEYAIVDENTLLPMANTSSRGIK